MNSRCRVGFGLALVLLGCGRYVPAPGDDFTLQSLAPVRSNPVTLADAPGDAGTGALVAHCSIADPVIAFSAKAWGCPHFALSVLARQDSRNVPVEEMTNSVPISNVGAEGTEVVLPRRLREATSGVTGFLLPEAPVMLAADCLPGSPPSPDARQSNTTGAAGRVTISMQVVVDGVTPVIAGGGSGPGIEQVLPLPSGALIGLNPDGIAVKRADGSTTGLSTHLGPWGAYAVGDEALLVDSCDGLDCTGPIFAAIRETGEVSSIPGFSGVFGAAALETGRIAILSPERIAFADPDLGKLKTVPLGLRGAPQNFATRLDGTLTFIALDATATNFVRVNVNPSTETADVQNVGSSTGDDQTWVLSDGERFLSQVGCGASTSLHGVSNDVLWTRNALCVSRLLPGNVLVALEFLGSSHRLARINPSTGEDLWHTPMFYEPEPLNTGNPSQFWQGALAGVDEVADALVITLFEIPPIGTTFTQPPESPNKGAVLSLSDGKPRFLIPSLPYGLNATSGFVADTQGHLYVGAGWNVLQITAADTALDAPAPKCAIATCNGEEVDLSRDPQNCGACGAQCQADQSCLAGTCD